MTKEEARSYLLEICTTQSNCAEYRAIHLAIDALEKQIPMKPKRFIRKPTEKIMGAGDCPMCGGLVAEWGKYCSHCGQRLDWGDE
jgi:hypothetical protein